MNKTNPQKSVKAVFFDRDGIINKDIGYVYKQEDFEFQDGIFDLLRFCKERGFLLLVVTNQSGIGRGFYTLEDFKKLSLYMQEQIKARLGFKFDSIYFCPHSPDENCECRKPKSAMIEQAKKDYNVNLDESFIIGDKITDMQAGQAGGIRHKLFVSKAFSAQVKHISNLHTLATLSQAREVMNDILNPKI
ncbi:D-glycero-alpha-D-manno-heptose-1,7-bisphosphate 7-phosphatase [Helicobacter sp. T3_23-1056]